MFKKSYRQHIYNKSIILSIQHFNLTLFEIHVSNKKGVSPAIIQVTVWTSQNPIDTGYTHWKRKLIGNVLEYLNQAETVSM